MATGKSYEGELHRDSAAMAMESNYQTAGFFPPPHDNDLSPLTNGMGRTTSRRRRQSGSGIPVRTQKEHISRPPAPEVPKAPPISYRPPYSADSPTSATINFPSPSFAERAQALTGTRNQNQPSLPPSEAVGETAKPFRRGSLNRPIGGLYAEIQQHKRDSYPPRKEVAQARRLSAPPSPPERQALPIHSSAPEASTITGHQLDSTYPANPVANRASTRRSSAGPAPLTQKEWAPDRSPLQKLEVKLSDISKDEKRARVQEAEQRLRDSKPYAKQSGSSNRRYEAMDRTSSKRTSGGTRVANYEQLNVRREPIQNLRQRPLQNAEGADSPATISTESSHMPVSDTISEPNRSEQTPPRRSANDAIQAYQALHRKRAVEDPVTVIESRETGAQPGRGVRFSGTDGAADAIDSREVPREQQELYRMRAARTRDTAPNARIQGASDALPRYGAHTSGQLSSNEKSLSSTPLGQPIRSSSGRQPAADVPVHKRHHLSGLLHRNHPHLDNQEHSDLEPKRLDEWKRAGTARLTTADFQADNALEEDQPAWWEGGKSGNRSKAARRKSRDIDISQDQYRNIHGKSQASSSRQGSRDQTHMIEAPTTSLRITRPYLGDYEIEKMRVTSKQPTGSHLPHFLHRSDHDRSIGLSSVYTYSCPNLALHNVAHESHVCEPYLSSELTQSMRSIRIRSAPDLATFNPPLYLKCGPLLRYTGLKRDRQEMKVRNGGQSSIGRETWRGTVMIVTADADSSYNPVPSLNLFYEPMDTLPPPSQKEAKDGAQDSTSEFTDPVAGLPKLSRSGRTVYVKPVDDLEHGKDLSRLENDDGLFEETRTAAVPTAYGTPDFHVSSGNPKAIRRENRVVKKGQQVKGIRLHAERGVTFWRFNIEVELGKEQVRVAYKINGSPSIGFWVPARGQTMNMMFHSCNGFSMSVRYVSYQSQGWIVLMLTQIRQTGRLCWP